MARSKRFSLNTRDFIKGFFLSLITAVLTAIYAGIEKGELDWKLVGTTTILTALSYIIKNLAEDENGEVGKITNLEEDDEEEPKKPVQKEIKAKVDIEEPVETNEVSNEDIDDIKSKMMSDK